MYSKHYTHRSSKRRKAFQMSYYVNIQCCNDVQIVKVIKGEENKHKYGLDLQWCLDLFSNSLWVCVI